MRQGRCHPAAAFVHFGFGCTRILRCGREISSLRANAHPALRCGGPPSDRRRKWDRDYAFPALEAERHGRGAVSTQPEELNFVRTLGLEGEWQTVARLGAVGSVDLVQPSVSQVMKRCIAVRVGALGQHAGLLQEGKRMPQGKAFQPHLHQRTRVGCIHLLLSS